MRKMFSYVLFGKDIEQLKFWNAIPYILLMNSEVYPDFEMKFLVEKSCQDMEQFKFLKDASERFNSIYIKIIDESSTGLKLTLWRMKPLWDDDIDYLFCRDIDYAVNILAKKSVEYFLSQSACIIHGMRSYKLHSIPLMAGMCGFEVKSVRKKILTLAKTFEEYVNFGKKNVSSCKDWKWGCDQALLKAFFGNVGMYSSVLDCPQYDAPLKLLGFNGRLCSVNNYSSIDLPNCNMEILKLSDSFTKFTGKTFFHVPIQFGAILKLSHSEMSKFVRERI